MNSQQLKEYRCTCGKLLFKGKLLLSTVEVKCRHCRTINTYHEEYHEGKVSFVIFLNNNGIVVDVCRTAASVGSGRSRMIGKQSVDLLPLLKNTQEYRDNLLSNVLRIPFEISHNIITLSDGESLSVESSFVPHYMKDGQYDGYRVFNIFSPQ